MKTINQVKINGQDDNKQLELFNPSKPLEFTFKPTKFTFVDFFSGIGGFRIPLEKLGGKCLGYSEIDKEAIKVYQQNFIGYYNAEELNLGDISKINYLPNNIDLFVGGVPCQPWSVAGKLKGFNDPRGQLWFDVIRLVKKYQPKAFIFENVKGLTTGKNKDKLEYLVNQFEDINYVVNWKVINSYDFGVAQNRERVFIVGIRKDQQNCHSYQFPKPLKVQIRLLDIFDELKHCKVIKKVKLSPDILFNGNVPPSRNRFQKNDELNDFFTFSDLRNGHTTLHSWDLIKTTAKEKMICLTLLKSRRSKKYGVKDGNPLSFENLKELITELKESDLIKLVDKNILRVINNKYEFVNSKNNSGINGIYRIFLPNSETIGTLTATGARDFFATVSINADNPEDYKKKFLQKIYKPQKFNPIMAKHCRQLQGFPDWFQFHHKDNIAKKQFGNSVPIPVVYHVAKELIKLLDTTSKNTEMFRVRSQEKTINY
ncbi:MAG: DNA cytosine methyltransferase [Crocosphaera sp.]